MFDLLAGCLFIPDAIPAVAYLGQCRRLEADQVCHLHRKPRGCIDDTGEQIGILQCLGRRPFFVLISQPAKGCQSRSERTPAICNPREPDRVALLRRCCLETSVIRRPRDDDAPDPFQNLFALRKWQAAEVVGKMPGKPAPLRRADVLHIVAI
ncbi:hypothetical protein D4A92_22200 (plasmid) [Rhizobium rosettiformans]|uniref:Uncharacterized protein n=1 Tax=Rhizobium rosettiformans TaxID=1368430 RepID=A0ABX7F378_9HYPH|nr:hypothetical protein D4A92_22200 [Rhizobium rosettiformans]